MPLRIHCCYQLNFPDSSPFLDRFFSAYRGVHIVVDLVPDQVVDAIAFREAFCAVVSVLPGALDEVGGDAGVERAMVVAREDVDAGMFHATQHEAIHKGGIPAFAGTTCREMTECRVREIRRCCSSGWSAM